MSYVGEQGVKESTTAKERVEFEKAELEERLDKLNAFINDKAKFDKLNEWQRMAMVNQSMAMCVYLNMLMLRLNHWED